MRKIIMPPSDQQKLEQLVDDVQKRIVASPTPDIHQAWMSARWDKVKLRNEAWERERAFWTKKANEMEEMRRKSAEEFLKRQATSQEDTPQ